MSKRNRSWRRSQNKRIEKKAFNKFYNTSWYADSDSVDERRKQALNSAKYLKNNMKNCSCWMCGNPRKWWKEVVMQERKANDIAKSQDLD